MNLLESPNDKNTLHLIMGLSGPLLEPLNNLTDIYFKLVNNLQDGDLLMLGGDFVQMCQNCCINSNDKKCGGNISNISGTCICNNKINNGNIPLSCCVNKPTNINNDLINAALQAMNRGARILLIDDLLFVSQTYVADAANK